MRIGPLRQRITLQSPGAPGRSSSGAVTEAWTTVAIVWADVRAASAQERFLSQVNTTMATVTHRITIRHRSDVTPLWRILYDSRILNVQSAVDRDGRRRATVILAEEIVPEPAA